MGMLFSYDQIAKLNKGEFRVYNYTVLHMSEVSEMNIRELAAKANVSTTTVLRFCSKMGCDGYTEFRYKLKKAFAEESADISSSLSTSSAIQFLENSIGNQELSNKLEQAAEMCLQADRVMFIGCGTSGCLAEYGAHFFASAGVSSYAMTDMYYPLPETDMTEVVLFVLSVSGETSSLISQMTGYQKRGAKIISITNNDCCTAANMSQINFSYYMPQIYAVQESRIRTTLTTQIPVIYLLETLTRKLSEIENANKEID